MLGNHWPGPGVALATWLFPLATQLQGQAPSTMKPEAHGSSARAPNCKFALAVGNSTYLPAGEDLPCAQHDAADFAAMLRPHGYDVTVVINGTKEDMVRAFTDLLKKVHVASVALGGRGGGPGVTVVLFFAGHGLDRPRSPYQLPHTYLVPVPSKMDTSVPWTVTTDSVVLLSSALHSLNTTMRRGRVFVFLDMCRQSVTTVTPRAQAVPFGDDGLDDGKGLEAIQCAASAVSNMISFAALTGAPAWEKVHSRNSYYSRALLEQLGVYGSMVDIRVLLDSVGAMVAAATTSLRFKRMAVPTKLFLGAPLPDHEPVVLLSGSGSNTSNALASPPEPALALNTASLLRFFARMEEQLNNLDAQIAGLAELDAAAKAAGPALPEHLPYAPWISWLAALLRQHATAQGLVVSVAHALWTLSQKPHGSTHLHMRPILPLVLEVAGTLPWDCSDVWFPALGALSNTCINSTEQGCSAPIMSWVVPALDRVLLHACGIGNALSVLGAVWAVAGLAERCPANHVGLLPLLPSLKMVLQTDPSIKTRHLPSCLSTRSVTERRVSLATEAVLRALGEVAINGEKTQDALLDPSLDLLPALHSSLTFYSLHEGVVELALRLLCTLSTRQANHDALLGSVPYIEAALRDRRARDARAPHVLRLHLGPQTLVTSGVKFLHHLLHGVDGTSTGVLHLSIPRPPTLPVPALTIGSLRALSSLSDLGDLRAALGAALVALVNSPADNATSCRELKAWVPQLLQALPAVL